MDDIVDSLKDVGLKDRSMVWNTDLVEVRFLFTNKHASMCACAARVQVHACLDCTTPKLAYGCCCLADFHGRPSCFR